MSTTHLKCKKCNSRQYKIVNANMHKKLICKNCGSYIKFLKKTEYDELKELLNE